MLARSPGSDRVPSLPRSLAGLPQLCERFCSLRARSLRLIDGLSEADCQVQSMPDASPQKWHLAHCTWFFETFVLERFEADFRPHHPAFRVLFNSYYHAVGPQHPRPRRGLITRPGLAEVRAWRVAVDQRVQALLQRAWPGEVATQIAWRVELGLQHEQQHQELMLTDLLHLFSCNPLAPAYALALPVDAAALQPAAALRWQEVDAGLADIGHSGPGFAFDNEEPRHRRWLGAHALADRLITEGEWAEFVRDGGYRDLRWWLSAGWDWRCRQGLEAPSYWQADGAVADASASGWAVFTLRGLRPLQPGRPVAHLSLFEADAFARWWSAQYPQRPATRLPGEAEWEAAAQRLPPSALESGNLAEDGLLQPRPAQAALDGAGEAPGRQVLQQCFGDLWEWTGSAYAAYPGFRPWEGEVGEYNGKFMIEQYVLRGGSFATPRSHLRASYRNFFPAAATWQFSGLRLACDL